MVGYKYDRENNKIVELLAYEPGEQASARPPKAKDCAKPASSQMTTDAKFTLAKPESVITGIKPGADLMKNLARPAESQPRR